VECVLKKKYDGFVAVKYDDEGNLVNLGLLEDKFLFNNELLEDLFLVIDYGKWSR
jgi:hypothetical protein